MSEATRRRVFVISDLHLGGDAPRMMSQPDRLATFIESLHGRREGTESIELVIAGDFIDFLAIQPNAAWTPDPALAREKFSSVADKAPFAAVFDALTGFVGHGHELTVLVGNHDVELGLPAVQDALDTKLGRRIRFIDDGRAYRIGKLLVEHGNRYDPPNENDWGGLRAIRSAQSRFEDVSHTLDISNGSNLVEKVLNPFKAKYPFLDLLQPQNELLLYLLLALEPALRGEVRALVDLWKAKRLAETATGFANQDERKVASAGNTDEPVDVDVALKAEYEELFEALHATEERNVGAREWIAALFAPADSGLAAKIERNEELSAQELQRFRVVASKALVGDTSDLVGSVDDMLAVAAGRMLDGRGQIQTVVMGHTHLAREVKASATAAFYPDDWRDRIERAEARKAPDSALYINTGTWADRVRMDPTRLDDDTYLAAFLKGLVNDVRPPLIAHYADIAVAPSGDVMFARLCEDAPT